MYLSQRSMRIGFWNRLLWRALSPVQSVKRDRLQQSAVFHISMAEYSFDKLAQTPDRKGAKSHMCPLCCRSFNTIKQLQFHTIDKHGSVLSGAGELEKVEIDHDVLKSNQGMHIISDAMMRTGPKSPAKEQKANLGIEPPKNPYTTPGYTRSPHQQAEPKQKNAFQCPHCPKSFRMEDALQVHISLMHKNSPSGSPVAETRPTPVKSFADLKRESANQTGVSASKPLSMPMTSQNELQEAKIENNDKVKSQNTDMYSLHPYTYRVIKQNSHLCAVSNSFAMLSGYCVSKLRTGFFYEAKVLEFTLALDVPFTDERDLPLKNALTVRCFDGHTQYASKYIQNTLSDYSGKILVIGALKLLPEIESEFEVLHFFPVIHVIPPVGVIRLLE